MGFQISREWSLRRTFGGVLKQQRVELFLIDRNSARAIFSTRNSGSGTKAKIARNRFWNQVLAPTPQPR